MDVKARATIAVLKRLVEIQKKRIEILELGRSRDMDKQILLLNQVIDLKQRLKDAGLES